MWIFLLDTKVHYLPSAIANVSIWFNTVFHSSFHIYLKSRWQRNKNKEIKTWESLFTQLTGNSRGCSTIDLALYCICELELSPHAYTLPSVVRAYAVWDEHCTLCICVSEKWRDDRQKHAKRTQGELAHIDLRTKPHWQNAIAQTPKTKMLSPTPKPQTNIWVVSYTDWIQHWSGVAYVAWSTKLTLAVLDVVIVFSRYDEVWS